MATPVKVGLFGGKGGYRRNIEKPKRLTNIEVWSSADGEGTGGVINGIRFTYVDIHDQPHTTDVWGTAVYAPNGQYRQIQIDPGDYVQKILGTVGSAPAAGGLGDGERVVVSSLSVTTHNGVPLNAGDPSNLIGRSPDAHFIVPLEDAGIVAFFARSNVHLNALGFYVLPTTPN